MITTTQLYSQLTNGLVKNTKFADLTSNKDLFRRCATRALTELHTVFNLQEGSFSITPTMGVVDYPIPVNWLNVHSCVTSAGDSVAINNPDNPYSVFINAFNQIQIPAPIADVSYVFSGRCADLNLNAKASSGNFETYDLTAVPIDIPDYMNEALELLTAYFMLQSLPSSAEFSNGAKEVFARYQEEINNIYDNMLLRTAEETGKHFGTMDRGWV